MRNRIIWFAGWILMLTAIFWLPLQGLVRASLDAGYSSHIVLIPFIVAYLVWSERAKIFAEYKSGVKPAVLIGAVGLAFGLAVLMSAIAPLLRPLFTVLSALLLVISGFTGIFGESALKRSLFPVLLLTLIIPVPTVVIDHIIYFLQVGSTWLTVSIFSLLGVPVLQNGFFLTVPGITVEVAKECSGINSTIALFILMLLFAHQSLRTNSRRVILVLLIFPLSILKNAIRIVTLTLLATKVDPEFLTGRLHHQGGFVFFLITLAVAYPIWKLLRISDERSAAPKHTKLAAASVSGGPDS